MYRLFVLIGRAKNIHKRIKWDPLQLLIFELNFSYKRPGEIFQIKVFNPN